MLSLIVILIIAGAAIYIVQVVPIDATMKTIIRVIIIVAMAIYALRLLAPMLPS